MAPARTIVIRNGEEAEKAGNVLVALDFKRPWVVTVAPYRKRRTLDQNALYWKIVGAIADHTGHSNDEIHEFLKAQFLRPRVLVVAGNIVEYRSTTQLSTAEMTTLIDQVRAFAQTDFGLEIPLLVDA